MGINERKWAIVFLSMAVAILIAGCFAGYFIVYVWTNTVRITSVSYATDTYVGIALLAYFVMCAFAGAASGLFINAIISRLFKGKSRTSNS